MKHRNYLKATWLVLAVLAGLAICASGCEEDGSDDEKKVGVLFIGAGFSTVLSVLPGLRSQRSSFLAGSILALLFIGYHFQAHHYPTHYDSFSINPQINLYYPEQYVLSNINEILPSPFYHTIANDSSDYVIVEATMADNYGGCFNVYQRYHRHRYIKGIFAAESRNRLNTLYHLI